MRPSQPCLKCRLSRGTFKYFNPNIKKERVNCALAQWVQCGDWFGKGERLEAFAAVPGGENGSQKQGSGRCKEESMKHLGGRIDNVGIVLCVGKEEGQSRVHILFLIWQLEGWAVS